jgi:hypothetical protein
MSYDLWLNFSYSWDDPRFPVSLAYHIADIYLEELDKALAESSVRGVFSLGSNLSHRVTVTDRNRTLDSTHYPVHYPCRPYSFECYLPTNGNSRH